MIARRIAIPLLGALLAGCAVGPDYRRPEVDLPGRFAGVVNGEMDGEMDGKAAGKTDAASLASQNWREVFTDTALQKLIDEALTAGPDALLAAARIREAEALAGVSRAPLYPQASVSLNTSPTVRQAGDSQTSSYLGGAGISWEIDLWGRYRRASEAARADLLASEEARYGMQASLVAGVARYYFQLATLHDIYRITERGANNQAEVLRLVRRLSAAGISTAAEERQQESALATTEASLPTLRRQIAETGNALAVLIGRIRGRCRWTRRPY
jgi:multidrug efflux system outer membrane protein